MPSSTSRSTYKKRKRKKNNNDFLIKTLVGIIIALCIVICIIILSGKGKDNNNPVKKVTSTTQAPVETTEPTTTEPETTTEEPTEPMTDENGEPITTPTVDLNSTYGDNITNDGELIVCLDPGHGGVDGGSTSDDETRLEKDDCLRLSLLIRDKLTKLGVTVIMTREDDSDISKYARAELANSSKADLLLSVHRNSFAGDASVKGFEAWIASDNPLNSYNLASAILTNLESVGITRNRGVKAGTQGNASINYVVNSYSSMPSMILELGFMSSPEDNNFFDTKLDAMAESIAQTVFDWIRVQ